MKVTISLEDHDIAEIIAKRFDVKPEDVKVIAQKSYEGQGPMEHEVFRCHATVTKNLEV